MVSSNVAVPQVTHMRVSAVVIGVWCGVLRARRLWATKVAQFVPEAELVLVVF